MNSLSDDCDYTLAYNRLTAIYTIASQVESSAHSLDILQHYGDPAYSRSLGALVKDLDDKMDHWVHTLPHAMRSGTSADPNIQLLSALSHMTLFAATINLHRPFVPEDTAYSTSHNDPSSLVK